MELVYALLIILIIACLIFICYIFYYNRLQDCKLKIDEAESIIDETLREKYDLMIKVKNYIGSNIKDNKIVFKDLDELKAQNLSNFELDRKLNNYHSLIIKINEDYSQLSNDKDYKDYLNQIKRADEKISAAKKFYNTYITQSNELVRKIPSNIIAKINNIEIKNYFDGKNMNDNDFNDFKL